MTSALITLYYPSDTVARNVRVIAQQADVVYLCDNSPHSHGDLFASIGASNIRYRFFGENLGVSRAFNRILKDPEIPWQENDHIFFFDQDSLIENGHIGRMISAYETIREADFPIGCLGPAYFNTSSGCVESPRAKTLLLEDIYSVSSIITSSMLTTYGDLRAVGFWNDNVFLDMADWDLCWRMTAGGKLCCMTEGAVFRHSLGNGEKKVGPLRIRIAKPFREYYQIREASYLFWKPYTPMKYRIRFLAMLLIRSPMHLIFLDHRKDRFMYMTRGLSDFFRKDHGPLDIQENE